MLTYEPGETVVHRLDPRSKLAFQLGFAATAFAHPTPPWLAGLSLLALVVVAATRTPLFPTLWALRLPIALLAVAPLFEGVRLGPPWFSTAAAWPPLLAGYRIGLVLLVSAAYVRTTPVRETRAAIQRTIPGKAGQFLGVGVALVARFLPVLRADFERAREAMRARLGDRRRLDERLQVVAVGGLRRALERADRLALALRARAFSWNPTLPPLSFRARDYALTVVAIALAASAAF
ncbi:MAG: energy-coupling factor transporter transmembrane protein EcfT [Halobacteriales archaeon]